MKFLILILFSLNTWASDPWENMNRATFEFNQVLDDNIFEPLARGYQKNIPQVAQNRVSDFTSNLNDVATFGNEILQFELFDSAKTLSRVVLNTTIGLGGIFDVASEIGLEKTQEDFGQTLAVWGTPAGNYLVLPIFGPSTLRDTTGLIMDSSSNVAITNKVNAGGNLLVSSLRAVDTRVKLLPATDLLKNSDDAYIAMRSAFLQKREYEVFDGDLPVSDDDF
jgi:phospholipid-binding lipoprotein MlaA